MGKTLIVQLVVFAGDSELFFEDGLHSYFAVGDIHKTRIEGLDGAAYSDRLTDGCATQQGAVSFEGETDRIYESRETLRIIDDEWNRTLLIEKVGSAQSVIWNPWIAKAAATPIWAMTTGRSSSAPRRSTSAISRSTWSRVAGT